MFFATERANYNGMTLKQVQQCVETEWKPREPHPMSPEDIDLYKVIQHPALSMLFAHFNEEKHLVGVAVFTCMNTAVLLSGFLIRPDARRQGYGRRFFEWILHFFTEGKRYTTCLVQSAPKNVDFWERKLGFTDFAIGEMNPLEEVIMKVIQAAFGRECRLLMIKIKKLK